MKHFRRSAFFVHASLPGGAEPTMDHLRALGGLKKTRTPDPLPEGSVLFFFNRGASKEPIRRSCSPCHGGSVVPAVALRYAGRDPRTREALVDGAPLRRTTVEQEAEATAKGKEGDRWGILLRKFWPNE